MQKKQNKAKKITKIVVITLAVLAAVFAVLKVTGKFDAVRFVSSKTQAIFSRKSNSPVTVYSSNETDNTKSGYLKNIYLNNVAISEFNPQKLSYTVLYRSTFSALNVSVSKMSEGQTVEGTGTIALTGSTQSFEINVTSEDGNVTKTYKITIMYDSSVETYSEFNYTGAEQVFTAPKTGFYQIECYGAGGWNQYAGGGRGYGAYTTGVIELRQNQQLYVYVGERGGTTYDTGGWNGGGRMLEVVHGDQNNGSGGGATDIRLVGGDCLNFEGLKSRIMVAAGGGCAVTPISAVGHGGTLTSNIAYGAEGSVGKSATQTEGYKFGIGQRGYRAGGGGGYQGGFAQNYAGSGGSSFISGYEGCNAIAEESTEDKLVFTDQCNHYSGYTFTSTSMSAAQRAGNGYAKISLLYSVEDDAKLTSLSSDVGVMQEEFSVDRTEYTFRFNKDEKVVNLEADTSSTSAKIDPAELKNITVPDGISQHKLHVYSSGIREYTLNFEREIDKKADLDGIYLNKYFFKFSENQYEYNLILPYDSDNYIQVKRSDSEPEREVKGLGSYILDENGTRTIELESFSEDGLISKKYTINISKAHSNKLKNLEIANLKLNSDFDKDVLNYGAMVKKSVTRADISVTPYDPSSTVTITGNEEFVDGINEVKIEVSNPNLAENVVYTININRLDTSSTSYGYIGEGKKVTLAPGNYQIELYGAGGWNQARGEGRGYGAYTKGTISIGETKDFYVYVGQRGGTNASSGSYNCGGRMTSPYSDNNNGSGGGETDIRLVNGDATNFESLKSRIMVAGGGGCGVTPVSAVGHGGTLTSNNAVSVGETAVGSTQTSGYSFGIAQRGVRAGGGGGYYGGRCTNYAGAGGSSYISGYDGCNSISEDSTEDNIIHTGKSVHYSGYKFTDMMMYSAQNGSDGSAKITSVYSSNASTLLDYPLKNLTVDKGVISDRFSPATKKYYVQLDSEETKVELQLTLDDGATVSSDPETEVVDNVYTKELEIPSGENEYVYTIRDANGTEYQYSVVFLRAKSPYPYLENIKIADVFGESNIEGFSPEVLNYHITLPYNTLDERTINAIKARPEQEVEGEGTYTVSYDEQTISIKSTSEDKEHFVVYNIFINKEDTTKIKTCSIEGQSFEGTFKDDVYEYDFEVTSEITSLNITAVPYDPDVRVTIKGAGYIRSGRSTVTITAEKDGLEPTVYRINVTKAEETDTRTDTFGYTGDVQRFVAPVTGYYKLECWGAGGWNQWATQGRGNGAYTQGTINLQEGQVLYIYVGQRGGTSPSTGGYNGGGRMISPCSDNNNGSGGGATDIRLVEGDATSFDSLKSRIMVAAGGGCAVTPVYAVSYGGTLTSNAAIGAYYQTANGATQTSGYKFGIGQSGIRAGGGGGYYGGEAKDYAGAGGSSYISGYEGCNSIAEGSTEENIVFTNQNIHYSGFKFTHAEMYAGNQTVPTFDGGNIMTGNGGDGYAKITLLKNPSTDNYLRELQINFGGTDYTLDADSVDTAPNNILDKDFDYDYDTYTLNVNTEETSVVIYGVPNHVAATVKGNGTYEIPAITGDEPYPINLEVTAENGDVKTYTINVVRHASDHANLANVQIDGLIESLISVNPEYGVLKNMLGIETEFDSGVYEYQMLIPAGIKELTFNVTKGHPYQTVTGDGKVSLTQESNDVVITVTPENGDVSKVKTYTYHITRDPGSNTLLKSLSVTNLTPENYESITEKIDIKDFNPTTLEYYLIVPNEVDRLEVSAEADSATSNVTIRGGNQLKVGLNNVYVIVDSQNGQQMVYIIHCYRMMNGNTFLSDLKVKSVDGLTEYTLTPTFNKILDTYEVSTVLPNEVTKVLVEATPEVNTTAVTGTGEKNLTTGVNTIEVKAKAQNNDEQIYVITINRAKSENNYLVSLQATEGKFIDISSDDGSGNYNEVVFNKELQNYYIKVSEDVDRLNLSYTKEDETAVVTVTGNGSFSSGTNEVTVTVTAENGDKRDYKIIVDKAASSNCNLKTLSTSSGILDPEFYKDTINYTVEVENEVNYIDVLAEPEDLRSTVEGNGTYALEIGNNNINVTVTSENGTKKIYHINIIRKQNSNKQLLKVQGVYKVLGVQDDDPNFIETETITATATKQSDGLTYVLNVPNETGSIEIEGIPEVSTSGVVGNGSKTLEVGENRFILTVTSEDSTTKDYTVVVNRAKSNNCNLKYLFIDESNYAPKLTPEKTTYETYVLSGTQKLNMTIETEDEGATYVVEGNDNFVEGWNDVNITVTASDGVTQKIYTIRAYVQSNSEQSNYLSSLRVDPGALVPDFNKDTLVYSVELPYEKDKVNVTAIAESDAATVTGDGEYNLIVGENDIAVVVTSGDGVKRTYQIKITRKQSTETRLQSLSIEGHTINPVFDKDITNYFVDTSLEKLDISAETLDPHATFIIIGNKDFVKGTNTVIIRVTAADGVTRNDYVICATKVASPNFYLSNLRVVNYTMSPEFNKTTSLYTVNVPANTFKVQIEATVEDSTATVEGDGVVSLNPGENIRKVTVTSESGKVKVYTITINKALSDDNYLKHLEVSNGSLSPIFNKDTLNYTVNVPYETSYQDIIAYANDYRSTVTGAGNKELSVGENIFEIKVTSESGSERTYKITVNRVVAVSSLLENLAVKNYEISPAFTSTTKNYSATVDYELATIKDLGLTIKTLDPEATYVMKLNGVETSITSEDELVVGNNLIEIEVTSSDGVSKDTYKLNLIRQVESNNFLTYINPSAGTLTPTFDKKNMHYTVDVDSTVDKITLTAVPEAGDSTVEGANTEVSLNKGENKFTITVTSVLGVKRYYYVTVNRTKSNNCYLSVLKVKNGNSEISITPVFNKETLHYEITGLDAKTGVLQIVATPEDELATVAGNGYIVLDEPTITKNIVVTAEDGSTKTYDISITRAKSDIAELIELTPSVGSLNPVFTYQTYEYELTLGNTDEYLHFDVETEDKNAVVTGNEEMAVPNGESTRTITITAEDGVNQKTYTIRINRIRTDDARLQTLTLVEGYALEPEFNENTYTYTINVANNVQKFEASNILEAIPKDADSIVTLGSDITLSTKGSNTFIIHVLAPDKFTTQDYKLNVVRAKNNNNYMASLNVDITDISTVYDDVPIDSQTLTNVRYSPEFNKDNLSYTLTVPEGTNKINITASAEQADATILGIGEKDIRVGDNVFEIIVSAENGDTKTYKLTVTRPANTDKYLKTLVPKITALDEDENRMEVTDGVLNPAFDEATNTYTVNVGNEDYYIYFDVETKSNLSQVTGIGETYIEDGENTRIITVTAEDSTLKTYTIKVIKNRTNWAKLKKLVVKNYTLDQTFDPEVLEYTLTVPNDKFELTSNEIEAKAMYEGSTIAYTGIKQLLTTEVNKYEVTVTSPDGTATRTYTLNITRQKSSDSSLKSLAAAGYRLSPEFTSDNTNYICYVTKGLETFEASKVSYEPTNEAATVSVDPDVTIVKDRDVYYNLYVTSEDETSNTTYRLKIEYEKSGNGNLQSLTVDGGTLQEEFSPTTRYYTVKVSNRQNEVTISAVPEDENATVIEGIGTFTIEELEENAIITVEGNEERIVHPIIVEAENGQKTYYELTIIKDNTPLTVITGKVITENSNNIHKSQVALYRAGARVGVDEPLQTIETTNDGTYSFDVADATIRYDIYITKESYLDLKLKNIGVTEGSTTTLADVQLVAGNLVKYTDISYGLDEVNDAARIAELKELYCTDDLTLVMQIEIDDIVLLNDNLVGDLTDSNRAKYGKYDLNEDGKVDEGDRAIIKKNYGCAYEEIDCT